MIIMHFQKPFMFKDSGVNYDQLTKICDGIVKYMKIQIK